MFVICSHSLYPYDAERAKKDMDKKTIDDQVINVSSGMPIVYLLPEYGYGDKANYFYLINSRGILLLQFQ